MSFFSEIRRRKVFQVAAVYFVVAWLLVQVVVTVEAPLRLPDWFDTAVIVLLAVGFPIAIILSWAFDLTSAGIERTGRAVSGGPQPVETMAATTGLAVNLAAIGALAVLLVLVGLYVFWRDEPTATPENAGLQSQSTGLVDDGPDVLPNSVAVLLCDNLSPDPNDAYFAASIHEEILNQLAKIRALNVIARTSVLQYAGDPPPIPQIARELNVQSVMECSVRYAGDAILVTAQLIDPGTNSHMWSDTYPGNLSDLGSLFTMQADIAMNIANALQTEFSVEEQENLERVPTQSRDAYVYYLRARNDTLSGSDVHILLDQAIELDPNFARAYAIKAHELAFGLVLGDADQAEELEQLISENAERAMQVDPSLGIAHAARAVLSYARWEGVESERAFERALELSPNDVDVLNMYGRFKRYRGEFEEATRLFERAIALDPNGLRVRTQLAINYRMSGDFDAAAALFSYSVDRGQTSLFVVLGLAETEALRGNYAEAIRLLEFAERRSAQINVFRLVQMAHTYAIAERQDEALRLIGELRQRSDSSSLSNADWARASLVIGEHEEALLRLRAAVEDRAPTDLVALTTLAANPWNDPEIERPEFRSLLDSLWADQ